MKKGRLVLSFLGVMFLMSIGGYPAAGNAEVNINIGVNAPLPALVISAPPAVVFIPGTYAYFAPDIDVDIFFFQGYWYRPYGGRWYRASDYNGHWGHIGGDRVPSVLINLPHDYRHMPPGHQRIPYGHLKNNWKTWERDRHWDRDEHKERKHEAKEPWKAQKHEYKEHKKGKGKGKHNR